MAHSESILAVPHLTDDDFVFSLQELYPYTDYFTINLCPSPFYRIGYYRKPSRFSPLLQKLIAARDIEIGLQAASESGSDIPLSLTPRNLVPPILVKINNKWEEVEELVRTCVDLGIDGIVVGSDNDDTEAARELLERVFRAKGAGRLVLVSYGGIDSGKEVVERIRRGASLVQLYSVLLQKGSSEVSRIHSEVLEEMQRLGINRLEEAVGDFYKV